MDADPRRKIMNFFKPGDERGPLGHLRANGMVPTGTPSAFFSVWRPTSNDAMRMMMDGLATGKGLNVKGKTAKQGRLSGFVPFLQITKEAHKRDVGAMQKDARIRIYYRSMEARQTALDMMLGVREEMLAKVQQAEGMLPSLGELDDSQREEVLRALLWAMADNGRLGLVNQYAPDAYGLDLPERLVWEAYVARQSIEQEPGWETGLSSEPALQGLNIRATRETAIPGVRPKVVLWQYDELRPGNPRGLLLAYEEQLVKPVVSGIEAFLIGSKGLRYDPLPKEQVDLMQWSCQKMESILSNPSSEPWTRRWFDALTEASDSGLRPEVPASGFGDPTSCALMESVVAKLFETGAVRYGSESSNFLFPEVLDEDFLIIWEGFDGVPWRYLSERDLRYFLKERIGEGYAFPLNLKWIICDEGWMEIFEALAASPAAEQAMEAWFPVASGLRDRFRLIAERYPGGFAPRGGGAAPLDPSLFAYELRRHEIIKRAKLKLRALKRMRALGNKRAPSSRSTPSSMPVSMAIPAPMPASGMRATNTETPPRGWRGKR